MRGRAVATMLWSMAPRPRTIIRPRMTARISLAVGRFAIGGRWLQSGLLNSWGHCPISPSGPMAARMAARASGDNLASSKASQSVRLVLCA